MTACPRPHVHFTPRVNWMNDPNGLTYLAREYHLYYQYNPGGADWGHMSWGHAVSRDLLHWQHLPLAIPEQPRAGYTIFSGSAVVDHANTSGFGTPQTPPLVAIFTADYRNGHELETIHLAYSLDHGRTFTEYDGNPVLDVGDAKFGDPKVCWHAESGQWLQASIKGYGQGHLQLYGSPNLRQWTLLSEFHAPDALPGIWECPDLFPLAIEGEAGEIWAIKVNAVVPQEQGGGGITRYFLGAFDGKTFHCETPAGLRLNADADDLYAEMTWNDLPDDRRILLGWVRQSPHPDRPWTGMQSIPRELAARRTASGWRLLQRPIAEMPALRGAQTTGEGESLTLPGAPCELLITPTADCRLALTLEDDSAIVAGFDSLSHELYALLPARPRITIPVARADALTLQIFIDHGVLELFAVASGESLTAAWTSPTACREMTVAADTGNARLHVEHWRLENA